MEVGRLPISASQRGKLIAAGYTTLSSFSSLSPSHLARGYIFFFFFFTSFSFAFLEKWTIFFVCVILLIIIPKLLYYLALSNFWSRTVTDVSR